MGLLNYYIRLAVILQAFQGSFYKKFCRIFKVTGETERREEKKRRSNRLSDKNLRKNRGTFTVSW